MSAFAVEPVASFPGFGETLEGSLDDSTWGYYSAFGRFDMSEGESVQYDLVANRDFILVVRDLVDILGPLDADYYEGPFLLNVTGSYAEGTFRAPYDGTFVVQFFVLYSPDYSWFSMDYRLEEVTSLDESLGFIIPWLSLVFLSICVVVWVAARRLASSAPGPSSKFLRFLEHYSSDVRCWLMPFVGMGLSIAVLILGVDASMRSDLLLSMMGLSGLITRYGIFIGLIIGVYSYEK